MVASSQRMMEILRAPLMMADTQESATAFLLGVDKRKEGVASDLVKLANTSCTWTLLYSRPLALGL